MLASTAMAQKCNRKFVDDGDYLKPHEFCDDDFIKRTVPQFKEYLVEKESEFTPKFPSHVPGYNEEQNIAWLDAIKGTYADESINFAGHYLFVHRGCGGGCHSGGIVDLRTGKIYVPEEIAVVLSNVNSLPATLCKKLDIEDCSLSTFVFKKNSKLIIVVGGLGEETDKRGIYHMKWENNQLKIISKVEKTPEYLKKKK